MLLDATDLNDLQGSEAWDEKRFSPLGLVDAVKDSTSAIDYITPSAKAAMSSLSSLRDFKIPILKDGEATVHFTPGFNNIPSNLQESDTLRYTAVDVFTGMRHYPAQYDNNQMDAEWVKARTMQRILYEAGNKIEGLITTVAEARKTQLLDGTVQVNQGDGTFTFDQADDTLKISKAAQKELLLYRAEKLMNINELPGNYRLVTNRGGMITQKAEGLKFGAANEKNLEAWNALGLDRIYETGNLDGGSDVFNGFMFRDGSLGLIENYPFDFRNGTEIDGRKWSISDIDLPYTRMRANVYVNNEATEATALVGAGRDSNLIMTHFSEMALWFRFFIPYTYNSDLATRANDVVKVKGLTV